MKLAASNELIEVAQESKVHKTKLIQSTVEIQSRIETVPEFDRGLGFFVNTIHGYLYNCRINQRQVQDCESGSIYSVKTQTQKKEIDTKICNNVMSKRLFFFTLGFGAWRCEGRGGPIIS
jgi:hypothetical protein